jgi:hypothetical protein
VPWAPIIRSGESGDQERQQDDRAEDEQRERDRGAEQDPPGLVRQPRWKWARIVRGEDPERAPQHPEADESVDHDDAAFPSRQARETSDATGAPSAMPVLASCGGHGREEASAPVECNGDEPLIYREEVRAILIALSDIVVELGNIRQLLEEADGEEEAE